VPDGGRERRRKGAGGIVGKAERYDGEEGKEARSRRMT
jgi:hypothetical protein